MQPALAFCHSAKLCVFVSRDICSVSLIYCCLSSYNSSNMESSSMSKPRQRQRNIRAIADHVTDCVFLLSPEFLAVQAPLTPLMCSWEYQMEGMNMGEHLSSSEALRRLRSRGYKRERYKIIYIYIYYMVHRSLMGYFLE